ncbi:DUF402 domain-containing protein [Streptosporangium subroseum]|uniref:DUF402 domain-containing protein n=1 Tax=Streptosporangium subroseum TaxID=106412 RepID=UPI00309265ED|nr:DUF402 domain-containing protein [Streptosporangium subroseum]
MTSPTAVRFPSGATAIRRETYGGRMLTAAPHRVIHDTGDEIALACWPGIRSLVPTTWIDWLQNRNPAARDAALRAYAARQWELGHWTWRDTIWLSIVDRDAFFSVNLFFSPDHGGLDRWYVNFQRPYCRTPEGIDTFDLALDLVADPDLSRWTWKDEDEYEQSRRMGIITDAEHRGVQESRDEVVAMIESRRGVFGANWPDWRADPSWPVPVLPVTVSAASRA